jgi:hypothetical protein
LISVKFRCARRSVLTCITVNRAASSSFSKIAPLLSIVLRDVRQPPAEGLRATDDPIELNMKYLKQLLQIRRMAA